jgi:hypothetical protein
MGRAINGFKAIANNVNLGKFTTLTSILCTGSCDLGEMRALSFGVNEMTACPRDSEVEPGDLC